MSAGRALAASFLWGLALCAGARAQTGDDPKLSHWALPEGLREISGLAAAGGARVYAHNDEHAIVYEIDVAARDVVRAFAFGDPTAAGDFEGVAVVGDRAYLLTSDGRLYEGERGAHRQRVRFNLYDTGVGGHCEAEGLELGVEPGEFLILCKRDTDGEALEGLTIFRWSLADRRPVDAPALFVPYTDFLEDEAIDDFRPSAMTRDPRDGAIFVVSSRAPTLYRFSAEGAFEGVTALSSAVHRQSEGLAFIATGEVIVADEGVKRGAGAITVYPPLCRDNPSEFCP